MKKETCKGIKRSAFRLQESPCTNKIWKDGYCKIHHPKERSRKQSERYNKKEQLWKEAQEEQTKQAKIIASNLFFIGSALCPTCLQPIAQNYLKCKNEIHRIYSTRYFL